MSGNNSPSYPKSHVDQPKYGVLQVPELHIQWWMYLINTCKMLPNNFFFKTDLLQGWIALVPHHCLVLNMQTDWISLRLFFHLIYLLLWQLLRLPVRYLNHPLGMTASFWSSAQPQSYHLTGWNQGRHTILQRLLLDALIYNNIWPSWRIYSWKQWTAR